MNGHRTKDHPQLVTIKPIKSNNLTTPLQDDQIYSSCSTMSQISTKKSDSLQTIPSTSSSVSNTFKVLHGFCCLVFSPMYSFIVLTF